MLIGNSHFIMVIEGFPLVSTENKIYFSLAIMVNARFVNNAFIHAFRIKWASTIFWTYRIFVINNITIEVVSIFV